MAVDVAVMSCRERGAAPAGAAPCWTHGPVTHIGIAGASADRGAAPTGAWSLAGYTLAFRCGRHRASGASRRIRVPLDPRLAGDGGPLLCSERWHVG